MADSDALFAGSVPEIYDRLLVPLLFASYARDLANRLAEIEPYDILEVAAGTGAVTRAMAAALPRARIVATDLNRPMLDRAVIGLSGNVTFREANAQALPFPDRAFDAVVCQFGAMFFPDRVLAYREAHRVLRPGGHFLFNVWDRIAQNAFAQVVTEVLGKIFPDDPPRFLARTPHGYCDVHTIRKDVMAGGFSEPAIETIAHQSKAASATDVAIAYCQGTPLRNEIEARDPSRLSEATHAVADAIASQFGQGPIEGRIQAHVVTARR